MVIPWGLLLQWRVPDPGLNLPFMCFQIVAVARARERPTRLNVWLSGLAFGLLFYVFVYRWTMAMAGLSIAFLLDRGARRVYGITLCIGSAIGLPQLIYGYTRYKSQRLAAPVTPLVAGATVAGDDGFCELAAVAEDQWVLSGEAVPRSMAVDDDQWELRAALNAYLTGTDRAEFEKAARNASQLWFWESPELQPQVIAALMRKYDAVVQAPHRFIAEFGVRYVALAADKAQKAYLREGWTMLQQGPYWEIWEREKSHP